jgi:hypothetical protein
VSAVDTYAVKPVATPNGFRWRVEALVYPGSKSGHNGETYFFGTPKRAHVQTFATRALADGCCAALNQVLHTKEVKS